jgi:hypothetical protein
VSAGGKIGDAVKQAIAARKSARSWAIDVPAGWEYEAEDTLDTFFDPDGVGALQFSSISKLSGDVSEDELAESIDDMKLAEAPRTPAAFGPFTGYALEKLYEDGQIGRYWFLSAGPLMLFATYFCEKQDAQRELRAVIKTLGSLRVLPASNP